MADLLQKVNFTNKYIPPDSNEKGTLGGPPGGRRGSEMTSKSAQTLIIPCVLVIWRLPRLSSQPPDALTSEKLLFVQTDFFARTKKAVHPKRPNCSAELGVLPAGRAWISAQKHGNPWKYLQNKCFQSTLRVD